MITYLYRGSLDYKFNYTSIEVSSEDKTKNVRYPREVRLVLDRIRQIREEKGMSLIILAAEADMSKAFLFDIETHKKMPSLMTLHKLSKGLGVPMSAFFEDKEG